MTGSEQDIFDTLCRVLAEEFDADPARLTPDLELIALELDQEEYHRLYERMAEETGVHLHKIVNSMPVYSMDEGEWTMKSLQKLAAFSDEAAGYLNRCDVHSEKETLRSIAQSFAEERYVSSGLFFDPYYPPHSKGYVVGWSVAVVFLLVVIGPLIWALWPCNPFRWGCHGGPWGRYLFVIPYTGALALALLASAYVPGWLALRSKRRRRDRRASG